MSEATKKTPGDSESRMAALSRWWARTFTRENVASAFKTFAWVAPLTILIWVYAEREQVVTRTAVIPIAVKTNDPGRIVRLASGDQAVQAEIAGPRVAVDRVVEVVTRATETPAVQISVDQIEERGKMATIDTSLHVGNNMFFATYGVTVRDVKPRTIQVFVDDIVERPAEVRLPREVTNLASPPVFEPRVVRIRGPRSVIDPSAGEPVYVVAEINGEALSRPGQQELPNVPLRATSSDPAITVSPSTVKATFTVNEANVPYTIQSMPVSTSYQPGLEREYIAEIQGAPILTNITVSGPADKIAMLSRPDFKPQPNAVLHVTRDDIGPQLSRQVEVRLPEGVHVVKEDMEKCVVSFKLVKQSARE